MTKTTDLADLYLQAARHNYQRDGNLVPILALHGGPSEAIISLNPAANMHPSDHLCLLTSIFSAVVPMTHIVTVTETWVKEFTPEEEAKAEDFGRGDLERMHEEGDISVQTAILVVVIDVKDFAASTMRHMNVDTGTEPITFDVADGAQWDMPHRIHGAWEVGVKMMEVAEDAPTLPDVIEWAQSTGLVSAVTAGGMRPEDAN